MADVFLLFLAAVMVLGTGVAVPLAVRSGRRRKAARRELERRERPRRLRAELAETEDFIRRVGQATADDELDRLEESRENLRWDGLSSR
jgi:hypothetical protein